MILEILDNFVSNRTLVQFGEKVVWIKIYKTEFLNNDISEDFVKSGLFWMNCWCVHWCTVYSDFINFRYLGGFKSPPPKTSMKKAPQGLFLFLIISTN
jgi:hypothetical protein